MREIVEKLLSDPRYKANIEYGQPRSGHPEGKVKNHIKDLQANLERLRPRGISSTDYWKLMFLIHVHDTFKAEADSDVPATHPRGHATIAREYACHLTDDSDLLNMIQFHDEDYFLWREYSETGSYDIRRFQTVLGIIQNWDLFLMFIIIDGCTRGKDYEKLGWYIDEVRKYRETIVDKTWVLPPMEEQDMACTIP